MSNANVRTALVTGAASGIGRAISQRLHDDGYHVVIADRDLDAATRAAGELGARAHAVQLDVTSRAGWNEVVAGLNESGLDVLVNNAGITLDRSIAKMTDDEWDRVLDVHLKGTWLGCQTALPLLQNSSGSIVNMSSEGRHGSFGQANYSAAKAGIVGLTRTIAIEQARHGIRANAVAPGPVRTPMLADVPDSVVEGWLTTIPLHRLAEPEEVAAVVAFLSSSDASYITGQVIAVDGGSSHP